MRQGAEGALLPRLLGSCASLLGKQVGIVLALEGPPAGLVGTLGNESNSG